MLEIRYSNAIRMGVRETLRTAGRVLSKVPRSIDRVQRYMFDIKPGDPPSFIIGMGFSGLAPAGDHPDIQKARQIIIDEKCNDPEKLISALLRTKLPPAKVLHYVKKIQKSYEYYAKYAFNAIPSMLDAGLSIPIIYVLFKALELKGVHQLDGPCEALPKAMEAAKKTLSPERIYDLFYRIIGTCRCDQEEAFIALPALLTAGLSPDTIVHTYSQIEKHLHGTCWSQKYAILALPGALKAKLTPAKSVEFFMALDKLITKFHWYYMEAEFVFGAVAVAAEANVTPDKFADLIARTGAIEYERSDGVYCSVKVLPDLLRNGQSPDRIIELFRKISTINGDCSFLIFENMATALDKIKEEFDPDKRFEICMNILDKCGNNSIYAFEILPAALEAGLTPDQFLDLCIKVIDKAGGHSEYAMEAVPAMLQAELTPNQIVEIVGAVRDANHYNTEEALKALPEAVIQARNVRSPNLTFDLIMKLIKKSGKSNREVFSAFSVLFKRLPLKDGPEADTAIARFLSMLDRLTDHNRNRILEILAKNDALYRRIEIEAKQFNDHYNLYMDILTSYKRLGLSLLDSVIEATKQDVIPLKLDPNEAKCVKAFIDSTHSFVPAVYRVYRSEGNAILKELRDISSKITTDEIGEEEIKAILKTYEKYDGMEFLLAIIQMSIPLSGASFVKREDARGLFEEMMEAGDLRSHIPTALRGIVRRMSLAQNEYALKEGEQSDLAGISPIFEGLRSKSKAELPELAAAIDTYAKSGRSGSEKETLRQVLYRYASGNGLLGETPRTIDFDSLELLEELFTDRDRLPGIFGRAAKGVVYASEILSAPLEVIRREKAKYELRSNDEGAAIDLRMVKGLPYSLWGLNAGVCIADDVELWKDPKFKLIAITDKETGTAAGFIEIYETRVKGRLVWTIPGFDPSVEFIGKVDPQELYDKAMAVVIEFAEMAGVKALYMPTSSNIHSNRGEILKVIKGKNYPVTNIGTVSWSTDPAMPFASVFELWKKNLKGLAYSLLQA